MKNCTNCGAPLSDTASFCGNCGRAVAAESMQPDSRFTNRSFRVGYSGIIDSDRVKAALKKQKRTTSIFMFVLILLPLLCFVGYGAFSEKMEIGQAAVYGIIVSFIFGFTSAIVMIKKKLTKPFEGVVIEKKKTYRSGDFDDRHGRSRTKFTVKVQSDDGKKHKKEVNIPTFNYLNEGDRVRFLPQFPQPFEKYDKGDETLCMFCSRMVSVNEDTCPKCHNPLIK